MPQELNSEQSNRRRSPCFEFIKAEKLRCRIPKGASVELQQWSQTEMELSNLRILQPLVNSLLQHALQSHRRGKKRTNLLQNTEADTHPTLNQKQLLHAQASWPGSCRSNFLISNKLLTINSTVEYNLTYKNTGKNTPLPEFHLGNSGSWGAQAFKLIRLDTLALFKARETDNRCSVSYCFKKVPWWLVIWLKLETDQDKVPYELRAWKKATLRYDQQLRWMHRFPVPCVNNAKQLKQFHSSLWGKRLFSASPFHLQIFKTSTRPKLWFGAGTEMTTEAHTFKFHQSCDTSCLRGWVSTVQRRNFWGFCLLICRKRSFIACRFSIYRAVLFQQGSPEGPGDVIEGQPCVEVHAHEEVKEWICTTVKVGQERRKRSSKREGRAIRSCRFKQLGDVIGRPTEEEGDHQGKYDLEGLLWVEGVWRLLSTTRMMP